MVTETSVTLFSPSWDSSSWSMGLTLFGTKKGPLDFEDMRLTIKGVPGLMIFLNDDVVFLANPVETFGEPNCFVTSHRFR